MSPDNEYALWRPKLTNTTKTFEEQKQIAEDKGYVASIGGWLTSPFTTAPTPAANPVSKSSKTFVSLENLVKDCQVELIETLTAEISQDKLDWLDVQGRVVVRALVPGETPKIQVKLALPEDCDEFLVHPLC